MFCPECGESTKTIFVLTISPGLISTLRLKEAIRFFACDECLVPVLTDHLSRSKRAPIKVGVLR